MPKLTLQFDGQALKEYVFGSSVTIGRLPDNTIVIDNPAVSGHHARVFRDGSQIVVEDLRSTNGTFVNERHVTRCILRRGDVLLVGKHTLVFDPASDAAPTAVEPVLSGMGDTVYLDTSKHRALLATLRSARAEADKAAGVWPTVSVPPEPATVGVLRPAGGTMPGAEYRLAAQTSLIGKSPSALVRLHGWFKPDVAVAISRNGNGYVATPHGGRTTINGRPLRGRHDLEAGDVLRTGGLTLEFQLEPASDEAGLASPFDMARWMSSGERAATARALT